MKFICRSKGCEYPCILDDKSRDAFTRPEFCVYYPKMVLWMPIFNDEDKCIEEEKG